MLDGGETLARLLSALRDQADAPRLEVLVPYDASIGEVRELAAVLPAARFLDLGEVRTARPASSPAGQHELYDRRRAAGLAAATGDIVAILEDRGVPRPDWARNVVRAHQQPFAVIGGAVECGAADALGKALYFCDFGRYAPPLPAGPAQWVTDINVSYKRAALERTRPLWEDRFHEPVVHWALAAEGETLFLSPDLVVTHTAPARPLGAVLVERFHWGRLFGKLRSTRLNTARRLGFAALSPALVPLLLVRHGRTQFARGSLGQLLRVAPAVLLLVVAWTAGEAWGCVTGEA